MKIAAYQLGAEYSQDLERGRAANQRDLLGRAYVGRGHGTWGRVMAAQGRKHSTTYVR